MHDSPDRPQRSGLSRRDFLRGTGVSAAASALTTTCLPQLAQAVGGAAAQPAVPGHGPGAARISLNVNGRDISASVEPRVTLLDALRNYMDVTGCKRVCDRGTCGACTVLLDGKPVYACSVLAIDAQGAKNTTIEALAEGNSLSPVM